MANTYSQIYIQVVFAVSGRESLIDNGWKDELYKFITGIVRNQGQKLLAINGVADHVHIEYAAEYRIVGPGARHKGEFE
jgi:putative transposase